MLMHVTTDRQLFIARLRERATDRGSDLLSESNIIELYLNCIKLEQCLWLDNRLVPIPQNQ